MTGHKGYEALARKKFEKTYTKRTKKKKKKRIVEGVLSPSVDIDIQKIDSVPTIVFACMLERLDGPLLRAVAQYFALDVAHSDTLSSTLDNILMAAGNLRSNPQCPDSEMTPKTICCFDYNGKMLCSSLSFDEYTYKVDMPHEFQLVSSTLTSSDKIQLLSQVSLFRNPAYGGTASLLWEDLTLPQMMSALSSLEIEYCTGDTKRDLKRRLWGKESFKRSKGKAGNIVDYGFHVSEPLVCLSVGSIPLSDYDIPVVPNPFSEEDPQLFSSASTPNTSVSTVSTGKDSEGYSLSSHVDNQDSPLGLDHIRQMSQISNHPDSSHEVDDSSKLSASPATLTNKKYSNASNETVVNSHIENNICLKCQESVTNKTLTCYLCKIKVHYPCYEGKMSDGKLKALCKTTFEALQKQKNTNWLCNNCCDLTFEGILDRISDLARAQSNSNLCSTPFLPNRSLTVSDEANSDTDGSDEDSLCSSLPEYEPRTQQAILPPQHFKELVTKELRQAIREDIEHAVVDTLHKHFSNSLIAPQILSHHNLDVSNVSAVSFADQVSRNISKPHAPSTKASLQIHGARQTTTAARNKSTDMWGNMHTPGKTTHETTAAARTNNLVDPALSVIIKQVTNKKIIQSDTNLKSEFNKLFNRMKIAYCKKTRYGNIILQLTTPEDVARVIEEWKPEYLKEKDSEVGTSAYKMKDQHLSKSIGIIHHVPTDVTDADLQASISDSNLNILQVRRMYRSGSPTNSCKAIFTTQNDLTKAIKEGFAHNHLWLNVSEFRFVKKPMQCHGCKKFDHPVKWCRSAPVCGFCASKEHIDANCPHKGDSSRYQCRNCQGAHAAKSPECPVYKEKLHLLHQDK